MSEKIGKVEEVEQPMNYPGAKGWMWSYCIYLGPFTDSLGDKFDLGVHIGDGSLLPSYAIVYGNECGDYISGSLETVYDEVHEETVRRYYAQR